MNATPTTVSDVMTRKIVTVTEGDALEDAEQGMQRLRFRHLPVVDGRGRLVGLLSHADLLHAAASSLSEGASANDATILQQPVRRVMQQEVLTVQPEDSLIQAGKVLYESKIGCLPVVDAEGLLLGILTKSDFIRIALELLGSSVPQTDLERLASAAAEAERPSL